VADDGVVVGEQETELAEALEEQEGEQDVRSVLDASKLARLDAGIFETEGFGGDKERRIDEGKESKLRSMAQIRAIGKLECGHEPARFW
jgi:hypothetical protein